MVRRCLLPPVNSTNCVSPKRIRIVSNLAMPSLDSEAVKEDGDDQLTCTSPMQPKFKANSHGNCLSDVKFLQGSRDRSGSRISRVNSRQVLHNAFGPDLVHYRCGCCNEEHCCCSGKIMDAQVALNAGCLRHDAVPGAGMKKDIPFASSTRMHGDVLPESGVISGAPFTINLVPLKRDLPMNEGFDSPLRCRIPDWQSDLRMNEGFDTLVRYQHSENNEDQLTMRESQSRDRMDALA